VMARSFIPIREAAQLYSSGMSLKAVAKRYGVCAQTILNHFRNSCIARRGSGDAKRGIPHSDVHRHRISASLTGRPLTEERKRRISAARIGIAAWNKGMNKSTSPDRIRYGSAGDAHWAWKGGVSSESCRLRQSSEYKAWRTAVFVRDNYTCVFCGKRGGSIEADHILSFATATYVRFSVENGRTLCSGCHRDRTRAQRRSA
jgi:hypothetical protein